MRLFDSEVQLVSRDDVLALLEDGPHATGPLAEWLAQPTARVYAALVAMAKDRLVKRVGPDRRWALMAHETPADGQPRQPRKTNGQQQPALRQPGERPAHVTLSADREPSWWVGKTREELTAAARDRQEQMRSSKENQRVPFRTIQ